MRKLVSLTAISLFAIAFSTCAFALNPQPEPPGKSRVVHTNTTINATGAMHGTTGGGGAGATLNSDGYCGTPVPGHPHPNANCTVHSNATGAVHGTNVGH